MTPQFHRPTVINLDSAIVVAALCNICALNETRASYGLQWFEHCFGKDCTGMLRADVRLVQTEGYHKSPQSGQGLHSQSQSSSS
jgi:hypothetical protein